MRSSRALILGASLALAAGVVVAGGSASAAPADRAALAKATGQRHADVVAYWTPSRMASAVAADVAIDSLGRRAPAKGKPGGGGGSTGTTVTGASWNGGGAVLRTTGKVFFTMGGSNYVCSGSVAQDGVAGRALVLTAGHCVFDDKADAFATNWLFIPAYDSAPTSTCANTVYGCWTASALVTTTQWAASDFNHDIGFAVMGAGGKTGGQLDDVVGSQAIAFNTVHPTQVYAFGYPAATPYTGRDLVYCAGVDTRDTWGGSTDYALSCSLNGGSSGGPWFRDFNPTTGVGTLTSVNSFTYRGLKNRMFGPYFGPVEQAAYSTAVGATTNTLR
jgi:hypothetical protein